MFLTWANPVSKTKQILMYSLWRSYMRMALNGKHLIKIFSKIHDVDIWKFCVLLRPRRLMWMDSFFLQHSSHLFSTNTVECLLPLFKFQRTTSLLRECWWVLIKHAPCENTCDSQRYLLDVYLPQSNLIISLSHYLCILVSLHLLHCAKWVLLTAAFVLERRQNERTGWWEGIISTVASL